MIGKLRSLFKRKYIYKSATDGRIVSKAFADANPKLCYRLRLK